MGEVKVGDRFEWRSGWPHKWLEGEVVRITACQHDYGVLKWAHAVIERTGFAFQIDLGCIAWKRLEPAATVKVGDLVKDPTLLRIGMLVTHPRARLDPKYPSQSVITIRDTLLNAWVGQAGEGRWLMLDDEVANIGVTVLALPGETIEQTQVTAEPPKPTRLEPTTDAPNVSDDGGLVGSKWRYNGGIGKWKFGDIATVSKAEKRELGGWYVTLGSGVISDGGWVFFKRGHSYWTRVTDQEATSVAGPPKPKCAPGCTPAKPCGTAKVCPVFREITERQETWEWDSVQHGAPYEKREKFRLRAVDPEQRTFSQPELRAAREWTCDLVRARR